MSKRSQFAISNGRIGLELDSNGRGYSYMYAKGRHGFPIDLTRRPTDSLEMRGIFLRL
jgi:hypothetical protein